MKRPPFLILLAAIACGPEAADEVVVPDADATPPSVYLLVLGLPDSPLRVDQSTGDTTRPFPGGDETVRVLAYGSDPEGVKSVAIWGGTSGPICTNGEVGRVTHPSLATMWSFFPEDPDVGPGEVGLTRRVTGTALQSNPSGCPAGYSLEGYSVGVWAEAENFHGGTATSPGFSLSFDG